MCQVKLWTSKWTIVILWLIQPPVRGLTRCDETIVVDVNRTILYTIFSPPLPGCPSHHLLLPGRLQYRPQKRDLDHRHPLFDALLMCTVIDTDRYRQVATRYYTRSPSFDNERAMARVQRIYIYYIYRESCFDSRSAA